jgi:hypothetical protein
MGGLAFEAPVGRCAACLAQLVSEGAECHRCGFGSPVPDFAREARRRMFGRWLRLVDVVGNE